MTSAQVIGPLVQLVECVSPTWHAQGDQDEVLGSSPRRPSLFFFFMSHNRLEMARRSLAQHETHKKTLGYLYNNFIGVDY